MKQKVPIMIILKELSANFYLNITPSIKSLSAFWEDLLSKDFLLSSFFFDWLASALDNLEFQSSIASAKHLLNITNMSSKPQIVPTKENPKIISSSNQQQTFKK